MFRKRERILTRAEINGLIVLLMRIDAHIAWIARESGKDDGEEEA